MSRMRTGGMLALALACGLGACRDDGPTGPAESPSDGEVFTDEYGPDVTFQAFGGSKLDAVAIDNAQAQSGSASLRVTVPAVGDPSGFYAGGAFTTSTPRDLSTFNALVFWARAATAATLDVAGFGNRNTETNPYLVEVSALPLTTTWQRFVVPIPDASRLTAEEGLFFFAEGSEGGAANTIWFDEIEFQAVSGVTFPRPALGSESLALQVGGTGQVGNIPVTYQVGGEDMTVRVAPGYFTLRSSDTMVARVSTSGTITMVGEGTAQITATLQGIPATGSLTVSTAAGPTEAAPTPTYPAADVISLFSDAYADVTVDTWSAPWDQADVADVAVAGNAAKRYANLVFAGIEFTSAPVNATTMTHFRMDVWTADPGPFRIKLVDFGANGAFGGGDDVEHELTFTATSTPALVTGTWVTLDIPLSQFAGMTTRGHVAQLIISGDPNTVWVDNVLFHR